MPNNKHLTNILSSKTEDFEFLRPIKNIPIFNGCVDICEEKEKDKLIDLDFAIGKETGLIQIGTLPNLNEVYESQTTTAPIGKTWLDHHLEFSKLISKYNPKAILEYGGANGYLGSLCLKNDYVDKWKIVEPNPIINSDKIEVVKDFFQPKKHINKCFDSIVSSHVFEHLQKPYITNKEISEEMPKDSLMFISLPAIWDWVKKFQPNGLNQEHIYLLSEVHFEELSDASGFDLVEKKYFADKHSIFYVFKNRKNNYREPVYENIYQESLEIYNKYVDHFFTTAESINLKITNFDLDKYSVYIFGAHVFTQFLVAAGLKEKSLKAVLDNNPSKNGKRLYGTSLITHQPEIIAKDEYPVVIVKAGGYTKEICNQLKKLNKKVEIIL